MIDLSRIFHGTGIGPDVVTVAATRETMTKAIFWARYPRALLIVCIAYSALSGFERAVSGQVEGYYAEEALEGHQAACGALRTNNG